MSKTFIPLCASMLLCLAGCGQSPQTALPFDSSDSEVRDLGAGEDSLAIRLGNPIEQVYRVRSLVHRWVARDIFRYDVAISREDVTLSTVSLFPRKGETTARFIRLCPNTRYVVTVHAWGNVGGTAAERILNRQRPASVEIRFEGSNDLEDETTKTIRVALDDVPFVGTGAIAILPIDGGFASPSLPVEGVAPPPVLVNLIPKMTSDTTPSGRAEGWGPFCVDPAYRAFDADPATGWRMSRLFCSYLGYSFPSPTTVNAYKIQSGLGMAAPCEWRFEAQSDEEWITLDHRAAQTWNEGEGRVFFFENHRPFQRYRLSILRVARGENPGLSEFELYDRE